MATFKESVPLWIRLIILILRIWLYVYDCLSNVFYELFSPPIARLERSERIKARATKNAGSPWCNVDGPVREDFPGKDTVDKLFTHVAKLYGDRAALGTRELLEVYEEEQSDGRVFEKWVMGKYKWESYTEIHDKIGRIASGLKNIVRNDCRAIIQAMSETEATLLVTSAELLTKIARVRKKIPKLRWLVYFRPLQPAKKIGDMDTIKEQFENVISLDELNRYENKAPEVSPAKRDDTAMIMYTSGSTGTAKGVIITHYNMVSSVAGLGAGIGIIRDTDTYIGYLPLAHILEVTAELTCLIRGCRIGYSSPSTLQDRGAKIKPGTHGDCWALKANTYGNSTG
ncbi:hypothetical protein WUBG_02256 [Wuchereria bancrofti]|uniref:long-chain-fatty-acid--CoA ligase n=1 Tax=Wuchereria bancrofti TaxID=6293 RepID=J9EW53_WUCBA|nr:hypothetical protein WUBG_02256 [Wuchereria bancrofti]